MRNEELLSVIGIGLMGLGIIAFLTFITLIPEMY